MQSNKITVFGKVNTGKTSFVHKLVYNTFNKNHIPTLGVSVDNYTLSVGDPIPLEIWDVSGDWMLAGNVRSYPTNSKVGMIFTTAAEAKNIANDITEYIKYLQSAFIGNSNIIIVFNKVDEEHNPEELKAMMRLYRNLGFYVTTLSVKTGEGMDSLLKHLNYLLF